MFDKYRISKFSKFSRNHNFPKKEAMANTVTVELYYHLAYEQMMAFSEATNDLFEKVRNDPNADASVEIRKCWSFAFGMYVFVRSVLEALSILRKMLNDTRTIEPYYENSVKRLVDIANDIVKHPMFKNSPGSSSSHANSIDIAGNIDVMVLQDDGSFDTVPINPFRDIEFMCAYLEDAAEAFMQIEAKTNQ